MTKDSAMRFGEYIAENNAHFEEWGDMSATVRI